jgi:transcriptional regulator with XRE-family HTH domain
MAGMSQRNVSAMERGYRVGSISMWRRLAEVLDVDVSWLTGDAKQPAPDATDAERILADPQSPPGLRDLAGDRRLIEALGISPEEWSVLRSLRSHAVVTKDGYAAILCVYRANVK